MKILTKSFATVSIVLLGLFGLTACGDDETPADQSAAEQNQDSGSQNQDSDSQDDDAQDAERDDATQDDAMAYPDYAVIPDGVPDSFPEIRVPFYNPMTLVAMNSAGPDMYVMEFLTDDSLDDVKRFYEATLIPMNGWEDFEYEDAGDREVFHVTQSQSSLAVAVGPELMDPTKTSIYYTLDSN